MFTILFTIYKIGPERAFVKGFLRDPEKPANANTMF